LCLRSRLGIIVSAVIFLVLSLLYQTTAHAATLTNVTAKNTHAAPSECATPHPNQAVANQSGALQEIGCVNAKTRASNLVGTANSASSGYVGRNQILNRPLLRPGEVLETIPGMVISQHSGEGKANQYYLRGWQLDHGTDLAGYVDDAPVNLPTHAHGQGYSDINWIIPELIDHVEYKKGPYDATQGDFATAGSYDLHYADKVTPIAEYGIGSYGYNRLLFVNSNKAGSGNMLYALEVYHDNNAFTHPDEYQKINGLIRYSRQTDLTHYAITASGYSGTFNSTDQIPQRLVSNGTLGRYDALDPTDGGNTHRAALSATIDHTDPNGKTTFNAYVVDSFLDLYSNFTYSLNDATDYYNVTSNPLTCNAAYGTCTPGAAHISNYVSYCPANSPSTSGAATGSLTAAPFSYSCGDQREQEDARVFSGFGVTRRFDTPATQTTIGLGTRNDNISNVGLYLTDAKQRFTNGILSQDHVVERASYLYAQTQAHITKKLRVTGGLRGDLYTADVAAYDPADSGKVTQAIINPKYSVAYSLNPHQEIYIDAGGGFHSNDARGVTQTVDPQTHAPIDANGQPITQNPLLSRAIGQEIGYRYSGKKLNATVSLWQLNSASELVFDGDTNTTSPGGPTVRRGLEFANYYTFRPGLVLDGDIATSTARFTTDPYHMGTGVPESVGAVISSGITVDKPKYAASLRLRYFGPRVLTQDGTQNSTPSTLLNAQYTAKMKKGRKVIVDVYNIFNSSPDDIEYYYQSWTKSDAANPAYANNAPINPLLSSAGTGGAGVSDDHFHPAQLRSIRVTYQIPI
jgi:hypothetical protein